MLQDKHYDLSRGAATQEDIKFLLATIADVQAMSLDVELKTVQIREQYRMLSVHGVQVRHESNPCSRQLTRAVWNDG